MCPRRPGAPRTRTRGARVPTAGAAVYIRAVARCIAVPPARVALAPPSVFRPYFYYHR